MADGAGTRAISLSVRAAICPTTRGRASELACSNGSVAIRLALHAAGIRPGDEVIVPPITFFSSASSVVEVNAVPIFADIHPESGCLDPVAIEAAITPAPGRSSPSTSPGRPQRWMRSWRLQNATGWSVIEDAAHAHGSEYKGKRLGSIGEMSTFSFQSSKNLTSGEGGIILTSDEQPRAHLPGAAHLRAISRKRLVRTPAARRQLPDE